jgi:regulator of sigma E protease
MDVIGTIAAFIVVLVVLVLVHEVGHFVVAKRSGITVQEFGIGFPPRIASVMWRGTRYSINWIPLGGFVKMLGEDGEVEVQRLREDGLSEPEIERAMRGAFNRKPIPMRIAVLLAGVAMNLLLAVVLFTGWSLLPVPIPVGPLDVTSVQPDSPASTGGLRRGDLIVSADGQVFEESTDLTAYLRSQAGAEVVLGIQRAGAELELPVTPRRLTPAEIDRGIGPVGFAWRATRTVDGPPTASNLGDALAFGADTTAKIAVALPGALRDAVSGLLGLGPNTGDARGPIGIAEATGEVLEAGLRATLSFVALLSVNLAVLNVLPFPPLDGGRIAVVLVEAVRRRRLPAEREALIYLTGFAVLIALVILISIQDIQRLLGG